MTEKYPGFGDYYVPPKYEGIQSEGFHIPMRDGTQLAVQLYLPGTLGPNDRIPALLQQSRYWRTMALREPFSRFLTADQIRPDYKDYKPFFTGRGYALVYVDVRGTGASFGTWQHPWEDITIQDSYDIVDWIVQQPWSSGAVGGVGISYLGTTAELLAACGHPAVKATIPMFNHPDAYTDIAFPGGIFDERFIHWWGSLDEQLDFNQVPDLFNVAAKLLVKGVMPVDGPHGEILLSQAIEAHHDNHNAYEIARSVNYRDEVSPHVDISMDGISVHRFRDQIRLHNVAIYGWGSWLDAGTADAVLRRFMTYQNAGRAVIGAWNHGGTSHASPYVDTRRTKFPPPSPPLQTQWTEQLRFFDSHLKDDENGIKEEKVLHYYTIGAERWQQTDTFPIPGTEMVRWYLSEDYWLSQDAPTGEKQGDAFTVDFDASTGDLNRWWELNVLERKTVIYRNRKEAAAHMLVYVTPPMPEDTEITGYPIVRLFITSTHTDGAFYVYLEDIDENGDVTYITDGQLRAIHRKVAPPEEAPSKLLIPYHTFKQSDSESLVPGEVAELHFGLLPTSVLIRAGHRLRLGIAGHDAGTFVRIPETGTPQITVMRERDCASYIEVPVVRQDHR